jgi:hypothetical protein
MKKLLFLLAFLFASNVFAADEWRRGYVYNPASASGADIWFGPGDRIEAGTAARGKTVWSQSGNVVRAVETGAVALRDGRSVALTATRSITAASVFGGVMMFANSPYGLAAALAIPYVIDWIAGDNAENIRINPAAPELQKKDNSVCSVSPCYEYQLRSSFPFTSPASKACSDGVAQRNINSAPWSYVGGTISGSGNQTYCDYQQYKDGAFEFNLHDLMATRSLAPSPSLWELASMADIAPYMTNRLPSAQLVPYLLDKGITFPATEESITGPSPALAPLPQSKLTTIYAEPADIVSPSVTTPGNPYGLPSNTPTVTSSVTGSQSLSPTSTSSSGPNPSKTPHPNVVTPTKTETVSIYNPTTDVTTSTTTKTQDGAKQETVTNSTTNITNTTNTSTAITNITNITTITNTTTNEIMDTKTDTQDNPPPNPQTDTQTNCEKNPDTIGCAKFGDITNPDLLNKETVAVTVGTVAFNGSAVCPSPISFTALGQSHAFSYTPLCDRLAALRMLFLAIAGFIAAWIVVQALKV